MDQRGFPVDPSKAAPTTAFPQSRLQAWTALAALAQVIDLVPEQGGRAAA